MALIKCPECAKDISTRASTCPHCGVPMSPAEASGNSPLSKDLAARHAPTVSPVGAWKPNPEELGCMALILFFFMPWAQLLGVSASGYELQKLGSYGNLAWLIPLGAVATIVAGFYGKRQKELAQIGYSGNLVGRNPRKQLLEGKTAKLVLRRCAEPAGLWGRL